MIKNFFNRVNDYLSGNDSTFHALMRPLLAEAGVEVLSYESQSVYFRIRHRGMTYCCGSSLLEGKVYTSLHSEGHFDRGQTPQRVLRGIAQLNADLPRVTIRVHTTNTKDVIIASFLAAPDALTPRVFAGMMAEMADVMLNVEHILNRHCS